MRQLLTFVRGLFVLISIASVLLALWNGLFASYGDGPLTFSMANPESSSFIWLAVAAALVSLAISPMLPRPTDDG
ncbi:hypothetical protein [Salininema proteolyticum]|uniref:Uncharacterized protein n=1 Tax=Salininema proteolyticum TaxID=1607685 RepID=A0ABV8U1M1_9ACTN